MSIPFDGAGDENLITLAAARVIAADRMPYLAGVIYAMVPVKVEGLGTFASDERWRMYWDPAVMDKWSVEEIAGAVLHEGYHCFLGHGPRFKAMCEPASHARLFNIAGDALINVDLRDSSVDLPEGAVYVEALPGATQDMSAEQIYRLLVEEAMQNCTCGQGGNQGDSQENDDQQGEGQGDDQQGEGQGDDQQGEGQQGQGQGQGQGNEQGQGGDQQGNEQGQGTGSGEQPCPVHGNQGIPQGWDCGSAADGIVRDYEAQGDAIDAGIDEARGDLIREQAALDIVRQAKTQGNVPAGLLRQAKELVEPVVDWRRELASLVRRKVASVRGKRDFTYSRPSRRQSAMTAMRQNVILPAMRQPPPPNVSIVIDTSGSMSDEELSWAISETSGVLRSTGSSDEALRIYTCDSSSSSAQRIRNVDQIKLTGGGGTDMRVGINAAMEDSPRPDAVVLITDGYTPYPSEPLAGGTLLIVALTDEGAAESVPDWARSVTVKR